MATHLCPLPSLPPPYPICDLQNSSANSLPHTLTLSHTLSPSTGLSLLNNYSLFRDLVDDVLKCCEVSFSTYKMVSRSSSTSATTALVSYLGWCWLLITAFTSLPQAQAANADAWRSRSIYQILTDRFARTDGSTTAPCDTAKQLYCGGTFQGIINQLDYIQGMGFTAVSAMLLPS